MIFKNISLKKAKCPLLIFTAGAAAGVLGYKYRANVRKACVTAVSAMIVAKDKIVEVTEEARESAEDIIAESKAKIKNCKKED